jgi:hypothetical protein
VTLLRCIVQRVAKAHKDAMAGYASNSSRCALASRRCTDLTADTFRIACAHHFALCGSLMSRHVVPPVDAVQLRCSSLALQLWPKMLCYIYGLSGLSTDTDSSRMSPFLIHGYVSSRATSSSAGTTPIGTRSVSNMTCRRTFAGAYISLAAQRDRLGHISRAPCQQRVRWYCACARY